MKKSKPTVTAWAVVDANGRYGEVYRSRALARLYGPRTIPPERGLCSFVELVERPRKRGKR